MYLYFRKEIDLRRDIELLQLINYHQKASMLQSTPHKLIRLLGRLLAGAESVKSILVNAGWGLGLWDFVRIVTSPLLSL